MEAEEFEFYFHEQGQKPRMVPAKPGETLKATLIAAGVVTDGKDDMLVYVGECVEALEEDVEADNGSDLHEAIDINLTIEVLEVRRRRHVHRHTCARIAVEVHFLGETKRRRFSPATTIETVTAWARRKFSNLDQTAASEYVLEICDTKVQPRADEHLGEVVKHGECAICFNLVKEVTPQG